MQKVTLVCAALVSAYYYGRFEERSDFERRVNEFSAKVACAEPERVASRSFDIATGEYKCRYYATKRK